MRALGAVFGDAVELYDQARLGYPDDAIDWALRGTTGQVLDLGAGTGKLTAALVARHRQVIAVDSSESMLSKLRTALPDVETRLGRAESTGLPDAAFGLAVIASALHWFARPAVDREISRVLRPDGVVAAMWNPVDPGYPLAHHFTDARAASGMAATEFDPGISFDRRWFGPTRRASFTHVVELSVEGFVGQLASRSYVLAAPESSRRRWLDRFRAAAAELAVDGSLGVPFRTTVLRAERASG